MRKKKLNSFFALLVSIVLHLAALTVIWADHDDVSTLKTGEHARVLEVTLLHSTQPTPQDSLSHGENQVLKAAPFDSGRLRRLPHVSQGRALQSHAEGVSPLPLVGPDASDTSSAQAPVAEIETAKPRANVGPRQGAWLDQLTEGVLRSNRNAHGGHPGGNLPTSAASAASNAMVPSRLSITSPDGGRREQVRSSLGTYCVEVPNAATSLRIGNAPRLATVSNCR